MPLKLVTVRDVAVEAITVPVPSGVNRTVLLPGMVEKLEPVMVSVVEVMARMAVLLFTVGAAM
jgi:hypothetical protein